MTKRRLLVVVSSICLILIFAVLPLLAACSGQAKAPEGQNFVVGSTSAASGSYPHVVKWAELVSKETPYNFTVITTGATYDNIERMRRGELMIAYLTTLVAAHEAWAGIGKLKDKGPLPGIRILYNYCIPPIYWAVREDSGINDIEQLAGKPYGAGIAGDDESAGGGRERLEVTLSIALEEATEAVVEATGGGFRTEIIARHKQVGQVVTGQIGEDDAVDRRHLSFAGEGGEFERAIRLLQENAAA